jgi:hypothetical protein
MTKAKLRETSESAAILKSSLSKVWKRHYESAERISTMIGPFSMLGAIGCPPYVWSIPQAWKYFVPRYQSRNYGAQVFLLQWDPRYAKDIIQISSRRAQSRLDGYIDPKEMSRVAKKLETKGEASIRFGAEKTGAGYHGERGDFCLVGGVIQGKKLGLYYRSLEMIGGFAYDLCLIDYLAARFQRTWKNVTIYAWKVNVFALKGNSNEKLFPKLQEIFRE